MQPLIDHEGIVAPQPGRPGEHILITVFPSQGLEGDGDLKFLLTGGTLVKVRSRSWQKSRYYKLQEDCKTMWHETRRTFRPKQTCEYSPRETMWVR